MFIYNAMCSFKGLYMSFKGLYTFILYIIYVHLREGLSIRAVSSTTMELP